jgi:acetyltransferase-like isoleucine patch superfamily enzyme
MKIRNFAKQFRALYQREVLYIALLKVLGYGFNTLRSLPLRWVLKAPGLYVGRPYQFLGTKYLQIGNDFFARSNLWIEAIPHYKGQNFEPKIKIGHRVAMGDSVHLSCNRRIEIGDDVLFGSNIFVGDHQHGTYSGLKQSPPNEAPSARMLSITEEGVDIKARVWIGNNVVILGNVTVGTGAIIAANSVVIQNVPAYSIVAGIPANVKKKFNERDQIWKNVVE